MVTRKRCHSDLFQQNLPRGTVDWKLSVAIPLAPHCVHAEVMPSPCCPPPPLIDGCIKSQAILLQHENCAKGNLCQGLTLHQPTQTLLRTMILRLANPSSSSPRTDVTLAPPHLPIPAPSPFVLHRDFPLRGPCAVSLLLASWRT